MVFFNVSREFMFHVDDEITRQRIESYFSYPKIKEGDIIKISSTEKMYLVLSINIDYENLGWIHLNVIDPELKMSTSLGGVPGIDIVKIL